MSIAVSLDDLAGVLADHPWGYLVTVRDDGRAQTLAIPTVFDGGSLTATVGKGTAANLVARPNVTLVFPGTDGEAMSLIVDGDATVTGDRVEVRPTWAVQYRPALGRD
jgi:general stress protein 26